MNQNVDSAEAKLDNLSKKLGVAIRTQLKKEQAYDNNIEFTLQFGRYTIIYKRQLDPVKKVLVEFSDEFYKIIRDTINAMESLWEDEENYEECLGINTTNEYDLSLVIEGSPYSVKSIEEVTANVTLLNNKLSHSITTEDFEEAIRIQKRIKFYEQEATRFTS